MRHVDDAHQSVGDGEPECGEQQHAAEREPGEHRARELALALRGVDRADRALGGPAQLGVGLAEGAVRGLLDERQQQQARRGVLARAELGDRFQARRAVVARQPRPCLQQAEARLQLGVALRQRRGVDQLGQRGIGRLLERGDRLRAHGAIGREQVERGERAVDAAANAVVDRDRFERRGVDRRLRAGDRIEVAVTLGDDELALRRHRQRVVLQRLEDRGRARVAAADQVVDGRELLARGLVRERLQVAGDERGKGRHRDDREGDRDDPARETGHEHLR